MKRFIQSFHVSKDKERAVGFLQIVLVLAVAIGTISLTKMLRSTADKGPAISGELGHLVADIYIPDATSHTLIKEASGVLKARADVGISPQVGGKVISVSSKLETGASFNTGETLFKIEASDYELALERAEAEVATTEAELLNLRASAENFVNDWKRVYPDQSPPALVAKEPQIKATEARLKAAKANVAQAHLNLARTVYKADYPIRIVSSSIERGQIVRIGATYGNYYGQESLRVYASLPPEEIGQLGLKAGDIAMLTPSTSSDIISARIISLGAALNEKTRLQPIVLQPDAASSLVPGTFVSVTFAGPEEQGLYQLPITALSDKSSVWTLADKRLRRANVDIVDVNETHIFVRQFDYADGVIVSQVPSSLISRPVTIRKTIRADEQAAASGGM